MHQQDLGGFFQQSEVRRDRRSSVTGSRAIGAGTRCSGANDRNPGLLRTGSVSRKRASGPADRDTLSDGGTVKPDYSVTISFWRPLCEASHLFLVAVPTADDRLGRRRLALFAEFDECRDCQIDRSARAIALHRDRPGCIGLTRYQVPPIVGIGYGTIRKITQVGRTGRRRKGSRTALCQRDCQVRILLWRSGRAAGGRHGQLDTFRREAVVTRPGIEGEGCRHVAREVEPTRSACHLPGVVVAVRFEPGFALVLVAIELVVLRTAGRALGDGIVDGEASPSQTKLDSWAC